MIDAKVIIEKLEVKPDDFIILKNDANIKVSEEDLSVLTKKGNVVIVLLKGNSLETVNRGELKTIIKATYPDLLYSEQEEGGFW